MKKKIKLEIIIKLKLKKEGKKLSKIKNALTLLFDMKIVF